MQGSDLVSSPTEKLPAFSHVDHVYMHSRNVTMLPVREKCHSQLNIKTANMSDQLSKSTAGTSEASLVLQYSVMLEPYE